jgi:sugar phosphate isomerase/epimerase
MVEVGLSSCCFASDNIQLIQTQMSEVRCDLVEWSGNISYVPFPDVLNLLRDSGYTNYIHHYFPPHKTPVLINLGHPDTVGESVEHIKKSLQFCNELSIPIYGVHAGYSINPKPSLLGRPQLASPRVEMAESACLFFSAIDQLLPIAEKLGIKLLLENNVVAHYNFKRGGENVYWLSSPETTLPIIERYSADELGILLDVGHLDVSASTIGYDKVEYADLLADRVYEVHISENNGLEDQNGRLSKDSWYWPLLKKLPHLRLAILEVYKLEACELGQQLDLARKLIL